MPILSVYAVSVTVGGWGSAIIDWQKYIYISKFSSDNYLLILKIKSSVLIKQGVLILEASFKRGSTVYVAAQPSVEIIYCVFSLYYHVRSAVVQNFR